MEIDYFYDGKPAKSIPDMWIKYKDNSQYLIEIKYSKELNPLNKNFDRTQRQISIQNSYCKHMGLNHSVQTEKEIRGNNILLSNMKMLIPYIKNRAIPIDTDKQRVLNTIRNFNNKATIEMIQSKISNIEPLRIKESIFSLLYHGIIFGNLDKIPYSNDTEVWIDDSKTNYRDDEY